ncbi:MAG TPA: hypothetical protein VK492_12910, partial [Chitinophagaceae bacterium]|nr:hypothetical protein [Chitinophagaceae bacterium]
MRIFSKIILLLLFPVLSNGQDMLRDSLRRIFFAGANNDSILYEAGNKLYDYYEEVNRDSAFFYADQCLQISRRNNKKLNESHILSRKAYQELNMGRYAEALQSLLASFALSENKANE